MIRLLFLAGVVLALPASAQVKPEAPPVEVMILGTFHFANPNLDVVKSEGIDVMTAERQAEVEAIVEALAAFRPTAIAIERVPERGAYYDSLYAAYRAGDHALTAAEEQQIGFRLAARFEHERLLPVDHRGSFPFEAVLAYAREHDPAFTAYFEETVARMEAEDRAERSTSIGERLRRMNTPASMHESQAPYLRIAAVGGGDTYVGADLLSAWYDRNIRIFANLAAATNSGDRVILIIGAGHAPILRQLVHDAAWMTLVEPNDYLK